MANIKYTITEQPEGKALKDIANYDTTEALSDVSIGTNMVYANRQRLCGIAVIENFIKKIKGFKNISYDHLIAQMCSIKGIQTEKELKLSGVSAQNIYDWFEKYGKGSLSLYTIDPLNRVFLKYKGDESHTNSLCLKINNNHSYDIVDDDKRQNIFKMDKIKEEQFLDKTNFYDSDNTVFLQFGLKGLQQAIKGDKEHIVINETWENVVIELIKTNKTIPEFNTASRDISNFRINNKNIITRQNFYEVKRALKLLENKDVPSVMKQYTAQSFTGIHSDLLEYIVGDIKTSKYNENVFNYIEGFKRPGLVEFKGPIAQADGRIGIDQCKADTYSRTCLGGEIPIFDENCNIEQFDGVIKDGYYHIEKGFYLFQKYGQKSIYIEEGFYNSWFVQYCLDLEVIKLGDIVEQFVAVVKYDRKLLKGLTEFIVKTFDTKDESLVKQISNSGTGCFNTKWSYHMDCFFSSSEEVINSSHNNDFNSNKLCDGLYFSKKINRTLKLSNHCSIYRSIIETSIINLHKMMDTHTNANTQIYGIKRDCIYGENFNEIKEVKGSLLKRVGSAVKHAYDPMPSENVIKTHREPVRFGNHDYIKVELGNNRNEYLDKIMSLRTCLIQGGAGHGKSYLATQLYKKYGDQALVLAPYNCHVENLLDHGIEANTIKTGLFVGPDLRYKFKEFPYKCLIIDESFVMNSNLSWAIYNLYLNNKDLHIYFFGDNNQCRGVEKGEFSYSVNRNYLKSISWIEMLKNTVELPYIEECARFDMELFNASQEILKFNVPKLQIGVPSKCERFICYTNDKVDEMNVKMMQRFKGDVFELPSQKNGSNSLLVEMKLRKGSPICAYTTKDGWYNNQNFMYSHRDEQFVYIYKKNDETLIPVLSHVFTQNFIVNYAMTVDRCQGASLDYEYCVMEPSKLDKNRLYTAITRARSYNKVYLSEAIDEIWDIKFNERVKLIKVVNYYKVGYIYKINQKNSKMCYIGSTDNVQKRFKEHMNKKLNTKFSKFIQEYKRTDFSISILEEVKYRKKRDLLYVEKEYIRKHDSNLLYNTLIYARRNRVKKMNITNGVIIDTSNIDIVCMDLHATKLLGITERGLLYVVRRKGIKEKSFSFSKYDGKENAYIEAKKYLLSQLI